MALAPAAADPASMQRLWTIERGPKAPNPQAGFNQAFIVFVNALSTNHNLE
jgi:hypothetical protein